MPKKPPPNGYYYFMLDFKRREERYGRRFPGGMPEVSEAASADWKALSPQEKERYNKLAKERKNDPRPNVPKPDEKRFNSQGKSFAELKREKERLEKKLQQESNFIDKFVGDMTLEDLHHKLIYLIHVNIFCKTDSDVYYPAEIGIVKFSLEDGVKDVFHRFIDPGEIAVGYSFAAKEHSQVTHKLTLPYVRSFGCGDFHRLYQDICKFLTEDEDERDEGLIPPMFTMYDDVINNTSLTAARKTLKGLWETMYASHDGDEDYWERFFKILPLPDMFLKLKNKCQSVQDRNVIAFPNAVLPKLELLKDTYHYDISTACKFHREEDIIIHCSKSFVLRWAFIIRDHCTDLIGVDMFLENVVPKPSKANARLDDNDDTASLAESMRSVQISEASIDFSKASARSKQVGGSSQMSKFKRDEANERGLVKHNRDTASTSQSYASVSNSEGRKWSQVAGPDDDDDEDEDDDGFSSVSTRKERDSDRESDRQQSIKSCPVAWPRIDRRPQNLPIMNENNFPSLGRGRGRGRGSLRSLNGN